MPSEIKTTLAVDGEAAFKRAIQDASKSISQMGTQLSLATAQFKADGDAMKLMAARSKTLKEEIGQQKEIVKSLEGAVKEVTARYGEDSKEAEKWQAQLNRAQTKLINLQHELDNNDRGLDKNGKAFDKDAQRAQAFGSELSALDKIQKSTTFQALNTALGNVEKGFKDTLTKGKEFSSLVWGIAADASTWADDLATESTKLGVSVETLQGWMDAAHFVDTEVSTIKSALVKLTDPTDNLKEAMRELGIHTKEAFAVIDENGAVDTEIVSKSAVDLLWEAVEALGKETDETKRNSLAKELFGKSYMEMIPLINQGKDAWDAYVQSAEESGRVLGTEQVNKLTTFNDALQRFNLQMEAFEHSISASIAPGLTEITDAGTDFVSALTLWAQSDTGQEKLNELSSAISGLVESLTGEENFNAVVEMATGVIKGFTGALTWIVDNWKTVAFGVGAIALATGAVKVGSGVLSFLAAIKEIQWLNVAKGASALAGIGGGSAATGAAAGSAGSAGAAGTGTVASVTTGSTLLDALGIGALAKTAYEAAQELGTGLIGTLAKKGQFQTLEVVWPEETKQPAGEPKRSRNVTGTATEDQMQGYVIDRTVESIYDDLYKAINDYDPDTNALDTSQFFDKTLYPLIREATGAGGVIGDAGDEIADLIYDKWIQSLFDEEWEGTTDGILNILQEAIEESQTTAGPDAESAGEAVSDGVADGIDAGIPAAVEAAGRLAAVVNEKLRSMFKISSPSKVTRGLGQFVGEGFALGIEDAQDRVLSAVNRMAAIGTPHRAAAAFAGGTYNGQTYHSSRSIYIDKYNQYSGQDVNDLMERMDAETRYENQGMGA